VFFPARNRPGLRGAKLESRVLRDVTLSGGGRERGQPCRQQMLRADERWVDAGGVLHGIGPDVLGAVRSRWVGCLCYHVQALRASGSTGRTLGAAKALTVC